MKNYTNIEELYDKYKGHTITRTPYNFQMGGTISLGGLNFFVLTSTIRHVKSGKLEGLFIDIFLDSMEWFFLRKGELIFIIDKKRLRLELEEISSNTYGIVHGGISESVYSIITKKILKSICDANDLSICISGSKFSFEIQENELQKFKILCKQFYNNFYDNNLYQESTTINLNDNKSENIIKKIFNKIFK
jgi:hypothetical protein